MFSILDKSLLLDKKDKSYPTESDSFFANQLRQCTLDRLTCSDASPVDFAIAGTLLFDLCEAFGFKETYKTVVFICSCQDLNITNECRQRAFGNWIVNTLFDIFTWTESKNITELLGNIKKQRLLMLQWSPCIENGVSAIEQLRNESFRYN